MTSAPPRRRIVTPKRAQPTPGGGAAIDVAALEALAGRAWEIHERVSARYQSVVVGAMPILYFGDSEAYARSPTRVITVGINPSDDEFPGSPDRFPLAKAGARSDVARYLGSLDEYFVKSPSKWFGGLEHLVRGLEASYWPGAPSAALHTDFCAPIATRPTWSDLKRVSRTIKTELRESGIPLWHGLVRLLAPDVLVLGLGAEYLGALDLSAERDAPVEKVFADTKSGAKRREPYVVTATWRSLGGASVLVVHGRAWQTPFGCLTNEDRESVGAWARELVLRRRAG